MIAMLEMASLFQIVYRKIERIKIHEEVIGLGAEAKVYKMSEEEIQSAIETGDIEADKKQHPKSSQQYIDVTPMEDYQANKKSYEIYTTIKNESK